MKAFLICGLMFLVGRAIFDFIDDDSIKFLFAYIMGGSGLLVNNYLELSSPRPPITSFLKQVFFP